MSIARKAQAGTLQSSDVMVHVEPADALVVEIESTVKQQFEHLIRAKIEEVLRAQGVTAGRIRVTDRGERAALRCMQRDTFDQTAINAVR